MKKFILIILAVSFLNSSTELHEFFRLPFLVQHYSKHHSEDHSLFSAFDKEVIYPVAGGWGRMGYTTVNLKKVKLAMFKDALTVAYCTVAPKKLAEKYLPR